MKKSNASLVVAICIPIVMIVFIILSIYIPNILVKPQVNFLYQSYADNFSGNYPYSYYGGYYRVVNGKLLNPNAVNYNYPYPTPSIVGGKVIKNTQASTTPPNLFIYDVVSNQAKQITYQQATQLNLDSNPVSSDGFTVSYGGNYGSGFPFFFGSGNVTSVSSEYIQGHGASRKLNITTSSSRYGQDFIFLAWIKN
jgi:hypothetical protein